MTLIMATATMTITQRTRTDPEKGGGRRPLALPIG